jgi:hypothetical protein
MRLRAEDRPSFNIHLGRAGRLTNLHDAAVVWALDPAPVVGQECSCFGYRHVAPSALETRVGEPYPVEQWRGAKATMSRGEFEERYPQIFLVRIPVGPNEMTPGTAGRVEFHTVANGQFMPGALGTQPIPANAGISSPTEPMVLPMMKDPGNPFPDRISIGRAPNCDIVIREHSVSKLHGHFRDVTMESAVFTDSRSANGSRINGVTISPGTPVTLVSLDEIVLGRVRLKLMTATDLYRWL